MTTQNENTNYDLQSFEDYPQAPMFPTGWDLSEMQAATKNIDVEAAASEDGSK